MSHAEPLVPRGAAFFPIPDPGPTRNYVFVLVPGFTLLAFSSAVEPLRIANQLSQHPLYHWQVLSASGQAVTCSAGIPVGVLPVALSPRAKTLFGWMSSSGNVMNFGRD
jgi:AraC family carnitine catabolism transcriptional activator